MYTQECIDIPFSLTDVCSLMNGCSLGLFDSVVLFFCFFAGRPITVTSCPLGRPRFLTVGGMMMPAHVQWMFLCCTYVCT